MGPGLRALHWRHVSPAFWNIPGVSNTRAKYSLFVSNNLAALALPISEASPYARAEKRAANYGTMTNNVATANSNILSACNNGPSPANYNTILKNIQVVYAQAAIRYARLLDVDYMQDLSTVDHRAEGQAFYRIIAPMVRAADSVCHDTMDQL